MGKHLHSQPTTNKDVVGSASKKGSARSRQPVRKFHAHENATVITTTAIAAASAFAVVAPAQSGGAAAEAEATQ